MSEQEIVEGNKLIAEFMGFIRYFPNMISTSDLSQIYYYPYIDRIFDEVLYTSTIRMTCQEGYYINQSIRESHHLKHMQFHKSWGWLMPVVEKISKIPNNYTNGIFKYMVNIEINPITGIEIKDMYKRNFDSEEGFEISIHEHDFITNVWLAIVEFLKWYNSCQK